MNISLQNVSSVSAVLTAQIEKADYQEKVEKALKTLRQRVNMPGFRKGMVPMGLIKKQYGVSTLNIAKRLMDGNAHPPTVYFPLIVHEAIMIEPTESETKQKLDEFVDTMIRIAHEAEVEPEKVLSAPHTTPVKRIDETLAARHPDLKFTLQHDE